jgi:hypothetical protein
VGRAVLEEAAVVRVGGFAPASFGVVTSLVREDGDLFRFEIHGALAVGVVFWLVQDVHGLESMPAGHVVADGPLYRR